MTGYSRQVLMFGPDPSPQFVLSLVAVVILSFFLVSIGHRFLETVTDRAAGVHLGAVFLSGLYWGFDVDPDTLVIKELVELTAIGPSSLSSILTFLTILSIFEIFVGQMYIWDKRGKTGVFGSVLVACSGYLLPITEWIGIFVFLFGAVLYLDSEKSDF